MAGSLAEPSPATTLSPPNPSPSLSLAQNLMDRLPLELKMVVVEDCFVEGGKPLLLRLMGMSKELNSSADLSSTSSEPLAAESLALESDKTFDLFTSHSREHGHLIKSVRLQRAPHGKWQYQRDISNIRWEGFKDSLPHLTSLQRLDISEFTSLTGARPNIDGDDYLLRAAPTFSNTLTSLRLSNGVERFYMYPSRLAELLNTLPLLTFLDLDDVATSHWTSRPQ
ncbi:hypothetical protein BCR35DRAFT_85742 [Leucosporidium creatinivorum]|uniref:Uncharacterized protein n=1 Tax=Leucosporidium creatinivorum TaxID=106004 RepID=A0A1Y2FD26_9BASI|nr:hypothetical protein BCR35DRAFT_85742 [Leucosporidium creatinivorum]